MIVLRGNDVTLKWAITRCVDGEEVPEDFSLAELTVIIASRYNRKKVNATVEGNVISIFIPGNTQ